MSCFIELQGIKRTFLLGETSVPALRGVDLRIAAGEMLAVWGPSGSGKSTLLNIFGLIDRPDHGRYFFDGEDSRTLSEQRSTQLRNQKIGFIFQSFNLIPVFNALENVMLPLVIQKRPEKEAKKLAMSWLEKVGLSEFSLHRPDRLSGGQRQRVAIARALITHPKLIIADEPTANLDTTNSSKVLDLLQKMSKESQVTCIFATHDQRLLERADRLILLQDGQIIQDNQGSL